MAQGGGNGTRRQREAGSRNPAGRPEFTMPRRCLSVLCARPLVCETSQERYARRSLSDALCGRLRRRVSVQARRRALRPHTHPPHGEVWTAIGSGQDPEAALWAVCPRAASYGAQPGTFAFLGCKHVCGVDAKGTFAVIRMPSEKSCRTFLDRTYAWLQQHCHGRRRDQQQHLATQLQGFYQYFALNRCVPKLARGKYHVEKQ